MDARRQAQAIEETIAVGSSPPLDATAYDADRPVLPARARETGDPLIGRHIDHFQIRALLGEGGMGSVYLAHDLSLERPVAIKVLRREMAKSPALIERLVLEARAQARLQHSNVVTIYYIGNFEGAPYFAMEYVRGANLADHVSSHGPMPWQDALECIIQTTRALMAAHQRGIIHRDIKPSNLLLSPSSTHSDVKVADFGLAAPPGFHEGHFVGSPLYASPEQISGRPPDHRSDIYSLAVTLHELITGAPPFEAENLPKLLKLHQEAPRPNIAERQAPWKLRSLITQMMDPNPALRPQTYDELLQRLEAARPRQVVPGGVIARGMALAVDLTLMAIAGQLIASILVMSQRESNEIAFGLFGVYYVLAHRYWTRTIGKRMFGLRIQGTTRAISMPFLLIRFLVEFWGPTIAFLMINLQIGAARTTNLAAVKERLSTFVGVNSLPFFDDSGAEGLLKTLLVPNLLLAIPWLAGFLFALFDEDRQAIHDRVARTRVVYSIRDMSGG